MKREIREAIESLRIAVCERFKDEFRVAHINYGNHLDFKSRVPRKVKKALKKLKGGQE